MDTSFAIRKLQERQGELGRDILNKLKVGSEEMAAAVYKYRAMTTVIDEIEKGEDDDDTARNRL